MYRNIKKKRVILTYNGVNSDEITSSLIGITELKKNNEPDKNKLLNKMPVLIAECFQNVIRHGVHTESDSLNNSMTGDGYFQIRIDQDFVVLTTVNMLKTEEVEHLETLLENVNELGVEELKKLRRDVMEKGHFSDKGGAGMGLIEMASKSGHKLRSRFSNLNNGFSRFFLTLAVGDLNQNIKLMDMIEREFNESNDKQELLSYKGDFSWETSSFIIEMLHQNFASDNGSSDQSIKELTVFIEIIQNMAKHALEVEGIKYGVLSLVSKDNHRSLHCGNYISEVDAKFLKNKFEKIKEASPEDLKKMYKQQLLDGKLSEKGSAGLGIIEMARYTNQGVKFSIFEEVNKLLYLSMDVDLN